MCVDTSVKGHSLVCLHVFLQIKLSCSFFCFVLFLSFNQKQKYFPLSNGIAMKIVSLFPTSREQVVNSI